MFKSISLGACLLCMAALIGAGSVSARAGGTVAPTLANQSTEIGVPADAGLAVAASLLPTIWSGLVDSGSGKNDFGRKRHSDEGDDEDNDGDPDDKPAPTPEPSTMLTFGTALAIGGGVFLLGRLRKERS